MVQRLPHAKEVRVASNERSTICGGRSLGSGGRDEQHRPHGSPQWVDTRHSVLSTACSGLVARIAADSWAPIRKRRGANVARKRPVASNVVPLTEIVPGSAPPAAWDALTYAEAHALKRSAPLTPDQFASLRQRAEPGSSPIERS